MEKDGRKRQNKEHKTQQRKIVHTRRQVQSQQILILIFFDVIQVVVQEILIDGFICFNGFNNQFHGIPLGGTGKSAVRFQSAANKKTSQQNNQFSWYQERQV
jgi:hypothetical protein